MRFFPLVFALSAPFWLLGALTDAQLLPGLPLSALGAVCPLMAALVLVYAERKRAGVSELLKRSFDYGRIRAAWCLPIILLMPALKLTVYGLMRWFDLPVPAPQFHAFVLLVMFLAFFVGGFAEELGWSGYITAVEEPSR